LGKSKSLDSKKSRYSEQIVHVPLKTEHEETEQHISPKGSRSSFRHSDWSRSSQSLDPDAIVRGTGSSRSLRSDTRSRVSASDRSETAKDEDEMKVDDLDLSTIEAATPKEWL
jgi:hypothetical protein